MEYKFSPLWKYLILFFLIYMFMKHQEIMPTNKLLINSAIIMLMVGVIDYMIIRNHPSIVENKTEKEDIDDLIEAFDSLDEDDLEEAEMEEELKKLYE